MQDTNELQDAILSLIARPKTSFRVGDVKQSIYHFHHTDPSLFLARYHQYSPEDDAEQVRIDLQENYRSCANVLHGVNWVMQRCMQPPVSDVAYDDSQALVPGRKEQGPPISDASAYQGKQSGWRRAAGSRGTGAGSPQRSPSTGGSPGDPALVGPNLLDKGVERPYTLSDIVVLVQARTHVSLFCRPCWKRGIEAVSDASAEALTTQECGALIQVLRVVDSLQDDIDFVTALRSPVSQCTAADLAHIRLYQRNSSGWARFPDRCEFFQAARHFSAHGKGATADRLRRFSSASSDIGNMRTATA